MSSLERMGHHDVAGGAEGGDRGANSMSVDMLAGRESGTEPHPSPARAMLA